MLALLSLVLLAAVKVNAVPTNGQVKNAPIVVQHYNDWTFLNCYADDRTARVLPTQLNSTGLMTVEKCLDACDTAGYEYGGLEYAGECYCGRIAPTVIATDGRCNMTCQGNSGEICGGGNGIDVYHTCNPNNRPRNLPYWSGWAFEGCFVDSTSNRVLPNRTDINEDPQMTIEKCLTACKQSGFKYGGLEYGQECWCGASQPSQKATDQRCAGMVCNGNHLELCGGPNGIDVYHWTNTPPSQTSSTSDSCPSPTSTTPHPTSTHAPPPSTSTHAQPPPTTSHAPAPSLTTYTTVYTVSTGVPKTYTVTTTIVQPIAGSTTVPVPITGTKTETETLSITTTLGVQGTEPTTFTVEATGTTTIPDVITYTTSTPVLVTGETTIYVPVTGPTSIPVPVTGFTSILVPLTGSTTVEVPVTGITTVYEPEVSVVPSIFTFATDEVSATTFAYPSATLSIFTGTTSFADSVTTIYEPIIILTTLVKTITTTAVHLIPTVGSTTAPVQFTTSIAEVEPVITISDDIEPVTTVSVDVEPVTSTSFDVEPFTSSSYEVQFVQSTSYDLTPVTTTSLDIEVFTTPTVGVTNVVVSATTTEVLPVTTTEYLPYTTTSYDVLGATGTFVTASTYTYTTTISKGVPVTTTVTTTIAPHH